ncbi:glycosyltransferase family 9 protein [Phycicoccus sp. M110.8]|uniref:glycosyltransferase family 9 protein n=1 Tax=Phycicoccus sp. M110.8 TaxID=3075433 RepID=UPI0028FD373A|nr:glycosyltransferase family 9 protein [Phycicoccus sp. M110.8]MDU0315381.1 glycosyltransferase family 9 protein [Phycicoccus sp. M110.8]
MPERAPRVLAVRLDGLGDVLLTGPALRQVAARASRLDLLVSPAGSPAAQLLPGVDEVLVVDAPWCGYTPAAVVPGVLDRLLHELRSRHYDEALVFTSYHQSPLPMALLLKWAGVARVSGTSDAYPGSLLDVRHRRVAGGDDPGTGGGHEVEAARALATAAGFPPAPGEDDRLRIRPVPVHAASRPYVVVHPSASVPSRSPLPTLAGEVVVALRGAGWDVVVTGPPADAGSAIAGSFADTDLAGQTTFPGLAGVLAGAACVVAPNTGPAHLAAAVGTPVVSLFSPVVPADRWAPWGVPTVVLGDQQAACRGTRARQCPVAGHPCLGGIRPQDVVDAVESLVGPPPGERQPLPAHRSEEARA